MNKNHEERRTNWPICPSVISAFALGLLVCYVLSAGPMSGIFSRGHSGAYAVIYWPLYFVTDRVPDPVFDAFDQYVGLFGDVPNLGFYLSRMQHQGVFILWPDPDPPPIVDPLNNQSVQTH